MVVIIGLGTTGKALIAYYSSLHARVIGVDDNIIGKQELSSIPIISSYDFMHECDPNDVEIALISPGFSPDHPLVKWLHLHNCFCSSELEVALQKLKKKSEEVKKAIHILAITGTNGKTTTAELTKHLICYAGIRAEVFGNIGYPLIEHIMECDQGNSTLYDVYVIEISSFQLERIPSFPLFTAGAILNIAPDHLDWHTSFIHYAKSKEKILSVIIPSGQAVIHASVDMIHIPDHLQVHRYCALPSDEEKPQEKNSFFSQNGYISIENISYPLPHLLCHNTTPLHDIENFLAAVLLIQSCAIDYEKYVVGYNSFQKGAHRLQKCAEYSSDIGTIIAIDDSKGTNIHATSAAVSSLSSIPIVLIAGGVHKGFPYSEWKELFPGRVFCIIAIGQAQQAIVDELSSTIITIRAKDMDSAVEEAIEYAEKILRKNYEKVAILLSPGCSSYDMFCNYKDRGEEFQRAIHASFKKKQTVRV